MEKPDRRPLWPAGLGLVNAGAVLGLAFAVPAAKRPRRDPAPAAEKNR